MPDVGQPYESCDEIRRIALWAVPRSVSTAFERIFVERDDAEVLHEPFSHAYYHGPQRRSDRFADAEPEDEFAYDAARDRVMRPTTLRSSSSRTWPTKPRRSTTRLFTKRSPTPSLSASRAKRSPRCTACGPTSASRRRALRRRRICSIWSRRNGQPGIVVDATDLRREPEGVMRSYCEAIGIPYVEDAMSWQSHEVEIWRPWAAWHEAAQQSTRIRPPEDTAKDEVLPGHVEAMIEDCQPHYERLRAHCLDP